MKYITITCHNEKYWNVGLCWAVMEVDAAYSDHADGEHQDDADGQDDNKEEKEEADEE